MPVWLSDVQLQRFDKQAMIAVFADAHVHDAALIDRILRVEADERVTHPQSSKCEGGQKVRDLDGLGLPVFTLLNARARARCRCRGSPTIWRTC